MRRPYAPEGQPRASRQKIRRGQFLGSEQSGNRADQQPQNRRRQEGKSGGTTGAVFLDPCFKFRGDRRPLCGHIGRSTTRRIFHTLKGCSCRMRKRWILDETDFAVGKYHLGSIWSRAHQAVHLGPDEYEETEN
jgi:hypothetical protein